MLKNCKRCRQIFNRTPSSHNYCPQCLKAVIDEIEGLTNIIESNKSITLNELSRVSKISDKYIKQYILANKIPNVKGFTTPTCIECGTRVKSGNLCGSCMKRKLRKV